MKKIILINFLLFFFTGAVNAQLIYNMGDNTNGYYPFNDIGQTSNALSSQYILFDDVEIYDDVILGKDSIQFTRLDFAIARLQGAPATTMNVWYTTVDDTATNYGGALHIPPTLIGSVSLPAATSSAYYLAKLGDSVNRLFRVGVKADNFYMGAQTVFIGVSFEDTTKTGWALGYSANGDFNDDVFWKYTPTASTLRGASYFGGNPLAQFWLRAYGVAGTISSLPVTFKGFNATIKNSKGYLTWATENESNSAGFEIEKSLDVFHFTSLGFVKSNGPAGGKYDFTDEQLQPGLNLYRLKQKDKDGKISYSPVASVNLAEYGWQVYPNPAVDYAGIRLSLKNNANDVNIRLFNMEGKLLRSVNKGSMAKGTYNIRIGTITKGAYIIKLVVDGREESKPVISR